jgi:molecular chaperone DnaK
MAALNTAWQAASQEMYQATQDSGAKPGAETESPKGQSDGNNVSDVEYEEVNDKK